LDQDYLPIVLGLNIHGLAIARSLARAGLTVHALTPFPNSPANATRFAKVTVVPEVATRDLALQLAKYSRNVLGNRIGVLFPTSDNMVRELGENWPLLSERYALAWSENINTVLELQDKSWLPAYCDRAGTLHPQSVLITGKGDLPLLDRMPAPYIIKPSRPQSGFKALVVSEPLQIRRLIDSHHSDLPFVVQQYILGDDDRLHFCCMYLRNGTEKASFCGVKLRSWPSKIGQGTVMAAAVNPEILDLSRRFVSGLGYSGQIAIEYKRDRDGRYWMIEPNVGRTEFCVDLAIQAGVNFPLIEYADVSNVEANNHPFVVRRKVIWYDTVNEPLCYIRSLPTRFRYGHLFSAAVFPYLGHGDSGPFLLAIHRIFSRIHRRAAYVAGSAFRWMMTGIRRI